MQNIGNCGWLPAARAAGVLPAVPLARCRGIQRTTASSTGPAAAAASARNQQSFCQALFRAMAAAAGEAAKALLSALQPAPDEDIVDYIADGLLATVEEDGAPTAETVREFVEPFLEEQELDEAVVSELSAKIAALFSAGGYSAAAAPKTASGGLAPLGGAKGAAEAAQVSRLASLAPAEVPAAVVEPEPEPRPEPVAGKKEAKEKRAKKEKKAKKGKKGSSAADAADIGGDGTEGAAAEEAAALTAWLPFEEMKKAGWCMIKGNCCKVLRIAT